MPEKCLGTFHNVNFSLNMKDWTRVDLIASDENIWIKHRAGWKHFPYGDIAIAVKEIPEKNAAIMAMKYAGSELFFTASIDKIKTIEGLLKQLVASHANPLTVMKQARSLVAKEVLGGRTNLADIARLSDLDSETVQKIYDEFLKDGLITAWGSINDEGRKRLLTMAGME